MTEYETRGVKHVQTTNEILRYYTETTDIAILYAPAISNQHLACTCEMLTKSQPWIDANAEWQSKPGILEAIDFVGHPGRSWPNHCHRFGDDTFNGCQAVSAQMMQNWKHVRRAWIRDLVDSIWWGEWQFKCQWKISDWIDSYTMRADLIHIHRQCRRYTEA